ncbi:MAG TPA: Ig-like domain-containing protein, partial [Acidimicrobiia bacterium]
DFHAGVAVVSDTVSGKVKLLDANTRAELRSFSRANEGLAVDPATGRIYVLDPGTDKVYVHDWNSGSLLFSFGGNGSSAGKFQFPYDATVVGGVLYVTDNQTSFISAFDLDGNYLGRFGGAGAGPYQFRNPAGIDHDNQGRLYVADSSNMRVQIFDTTRAKPAYETTKPTLTPSAPASGAIVQGGPVRVAGTATDNAGIARVEASVRNEAGLWFDGRTTTWVGTQTWNQVPWWGADIRSVAYEWRFVAVDYDRSYHVEVRPADISNNLGTIRTADITVRVPTADSADPQVGLTAPTAGQQVSAGQPVAITGSASDNVGISRTAFAVQRSDTAQWLHADGSWGASAWIDTPPTPAGAPAVTFAASFTPPAAGQYTVSVQAWDFAGHEDATRPLVQITATAADTTAPNGTLTSPKANQAVPLAAQIVFTGNATDDRGVATVEIALKNNATGLWLGPSGTWGAFQWVPAILATPGGTATGWTYTWNAPVAGAFTLQVRARDATGNIDPTRPNVPFTVVN